MSNDIFFTAHGLVLLRSPARSEGECQEPLEALLDFDTPSTLTEWIVRVAQDDHLMEALRIAVPVLVRDIRLISTGERDRDLRKLRKVALSTLQYVIRMRSRSTPFGLFSSVQSARLSPDVDLSGFALDGHRYKSVRPDGAWIARLATRLRRTLPSMIHGLTVWRNPCSQVYSNHFVGACPQWRSDASNSCEPASEPVDALARAVLDECHRPVPGGEVIASVVARCGVTDSDVVAAINRLIDLGALVSDLLTIRDPGADLGTLADRAAQAGGEEEAAKLIRIRRAIEDYEATPIGRGLPQVESVVQSMGDVCDAENFLAVDTFWNGSLELPAGVGQEAAAAASLLLRTAGSTTERDHLDEYHQRFMERYDLDRMVPILELLNPITGLGAPRTYRHPGSDRRADFAEYASHSASQPEATGTMEAFRAALLAEGLKSGRLAVQVTDDHLRHLPDADPQPPRLWGYELYARLLAESPEELVQGNFMLALGPHPGSCTLGASYGRFASVLGLGGYRELLGLNEADDHSERLVVLESLPHEAKHLNVTGASAAHPLQVAIGFLPGDGEEHTYLDVEKIHVGATRSGLFLHSTDLGRICVVSGSMLRTQNLPDVARLMVDIGARGRTRVEGWTWGPLATMPVLPRIEYGRSILSPASWSTEPVQSAASTRSKDWDDAVDDWRGKWDVPAQVQAGLEDRLVCLDLTIAAHREVLRRLVRGAGAPRVVEMPGGSDRRDGWLTKDGLAHPGEVVIPLLPTVTDGHKTSDTGQQEVDVPADARVSLPGSDWMYVKIYIPTYVQNLFLTDVLHPALSDLIEAGRCTKWFFIRYRDPEPHLRLRFHGNPEAMVSALLPRLTEIVAQAIADGLASRMALETYEAELERYGGTIGLGLAEEVFQDDSTMVMQVLQDSARADEQGHVVDRCIFAASVVSFIYEQFGLKAADLACSDPTSRSRPTPSTLKQILDSWQDVRDRQDVHGRKLAAYAAHARTVEQEGRHQFTQRAAASVAHMFVNRLVGVDPVFEHKALDFSYAAIRYNEGRAEHHR
ncbi:lantibiotic dehydratase [Actinosynnema sp. NPDC050436]|uniref:lantibiotic dehydratase n=1 Tax=Actinosynnema sp. NPDC050436 TaxID=3155659 RepID=UPI0033C2656A